MVPIRRRPIVLPAAVALVVVCGSGAPVGAQEPDDSSAITPLVEEFCVRCHGPQTPSAGIDLATLSQVRPLVRHRDAWDRVVGMLDTGRMPPPTATQPSVAVRAEMLAILNREIRDFDYSTIDDPGFEPMRRLTHAEYDNTLRDLFGVELRLTDRFPDELTGVERVRELRQHALPAALADGTVYRGGRARRRAGLAGGADNRDP